jgi:uncharacterized protein YhaN
LLDGLFGIHPQTPESFVHAYPNLRIGVTLSWDGGGLSFIRRKGNKQTLRGQDDSTVVEDIALERALHGITRETFAMMFGISHETLIEGGRALARGEGEIGQLLFASAAGLTGLQDTLSRPETEAAELYTPRANAKAVHRSLRDFRDAEQEFAKSQVKVTRFGASHYLATWTGRGGSRRTFPGCTPAGGLRRALTGYGRTFGHGTNHLLNRERVVEFQTRAGERPIGDQI